MDTILAILTVLGLTLLGFLGAEVQNALLDKQEKTSKVYYTIIGIEFSEKDAQRLLFAIILSIVIMLFQPLVKELTGYDVKGFIYIITGYSPSTVLLLIRKIFKKKTGQ